MTFPAWFAFYRDPAMIRQPSACVVYAALLGIERIFYDPHPVKAWVLADELGLKKGTVLHALDALVAGGYLVEHDRSANNVRTFTVATTLSAKVA
jgi:hypothetical protein